MGLLIVVMFLDLHHKHRNTVIIDVVDNAVVGLIMMSLLP